MPTYTTQKNSLSLALADGKQYVFRVRTIVDGIEYASDYSSPATAVVPVGTTVNGLSGAVNLVSGDNVAITLDGQNLTITASANLSGYATENYVDSSVANLVNAATTVNGLSGDVTLVEGDNVNLTTSGQNITIAVPDAGITWSSPPQNSSSPGSPGDVAYDDNYFYLRTSQAWRQVALSPISTAITISQQPADASVKDGDSASFTVLATAGGNAISYQWEASTDNGSTFADLSGETSNTLAVTASLAGNGTQYRVGLSAAGAADVTSSVATLTVSETLRIMAESGDGLTLESGGYLLHDGVAPPWTLSLSGPSNQTAVNGNATFAVTAAVSDNSSLSYQWEEALLTAGGETWTQRTMPASEYWRSVTYGNGLFVAVGSQSNIAATSPDGITWTLRALPESAFWYSVTYGNGVFVAVAYNSNIAATSPDGITWTQRTLPAAANWYSVTYGNGLFVAVGSQSNIAATSPDGITWTLRALPESAFWYSVTYGNGVFVAVAYNSNIAATSPDGITWTQRTLPASEYWRSVTYGNGVFVAVAVISNIAATSPDGALTFSTLSGETASTLALTGLTLADDGNRYRVVVDSPSVEPVTSDAATLTVN